MLPTQDAFARALDDALRVAVPRALAIPAVTALVVDPTQPEHAAIAIDRVLAALDRAGVPVRRALVLLPAVQGKAVTPDALRVIAGSCAVPVVPHDPDRSPCFAGPAGPGTRGFELNDELREAEAIILAGAVEAPGERDAVHAVLALLHPGLASRRAARIGSAREVCEQVGVDLAMAWWRDTAGVWQASAGSFDSMRIRGRTAES